MVTPLSESFRRDIFGNDPNLAFQTSVNQANLTPNATNFFRQRTSDFLKQFEGAFGQRLNQTGQADLNPLDFFSGSAGLENPFNFQQQFSQFTPQQRGEDTRRFNPNTRFIFF